MKYKPVRDRCCQNESGSNDYGFEPYSWAAKRLLDSICLYAQVIKKRRKNRVITILYGHIQP